MYIFQTKSKTIILDMISSSEAHFSDINLTIRKIKKINGEDQGSFKSMSWEGRDESAEHRGFLGQ